MSELLTLRVIWRSGRTVRLLIYELSEEGPAKRYIDPAPPGDSTARRRSRPPLSDGDVSSLPRLRERLADLTRRAANDSTVDAAVLTSAVPQLLETLDVSGTPTDPIPIELDG